ncbi:MAG: redoxin domain-containing protein [Lewinellaceae bacterium]|nr:redoxin domain-containing protein [Lewinellaceae bacterium]
MFQKILLPVFLLLSSTLAATQAPDFNVTDSDGNTHNLYADYVNQDKVVVLEIFFTTCPPCATHAPYWKTLYENVQMQYPGQVEFFMLSDKSADVNTLVSQYKIDKNLAMPGVGSQGGSLEAVQPYKSGQFGPFYGTPTFVIITPGTGEVIYDVRGGGASSTMGLIQQEIDQLLAVPQCHILTTQGDTLKQYGLQVNIPGGNPVFSQVQDGVFSLENFSGLPSLPFYEMIPSKTDDPLNGVSTFDLVQINKQILGIAPFTAPWQFVAGDANNSGTITTFDIVEIRKLILGVYDSLPNATSWVFSPPLDSIFPQECPEFLAIKKGDVNGNAIPDSLQAALDRGAYGLHFELDNPDVTANERFAVNIRPEATVEVLGLQAAFRFDPEALEILSVRSGNLPGFDETCWHQQDGRVAVSWSSGYPETARAFEPVITLELRASRNTTLSEVLMPESSRLPAEVYDHEGIVHPMIWSAPARVVGPAVLTPNPARGFFVLSLEHANPEKTEVRLLGTDGRIMWAQHLDLVAGPNRLELRPESLPAGLYAVHVGGCTVGKLLWLGN